MSQYRAGWVQVVSGSTRVISTGTDWSTIDVGDIFLVRSNNVPYFVASKSTVSGNWEVALSAPYLQASATGQSYAITTNFTSLLNIPLIAPGDVETATIFNRAMAIIDQEFYEVGGGTGVQQQIFEVTLPTGVNKYNVSYPSGAFTSIPKIVMSLEMPPTSEYMYNVHSSGVSATGFWAIMSNTINANSTGFKLHIHARTN